MNSPALPCRRKDNSLANLIEVAVAYQTELGYPSAKIYLLEHGVPNDIIRRVLATSEQRRASSAQGAP